MITKSYSPCMYGDNAIPNTCCLLRSPQISRITNGVRCNAIQTLQHQRLLWYRRRGYVYNMHFKFNHYTTICHAWDIPIYNYDIMSSCTVFLQMVALYKDPKGEKVFDKYGTPSFMSQQQKQQQADSAISTIGTTDSRLKKRIQELENTIAAKQVRIPIHIQCI